jgi:hypothetical protein
MCGFMKRYIAVNRTVFVSGLKVPQYAGPQRVGREYFSLAVEKSVKLIEIDGLSHVGRNQLVVRAWLLEHCEQRHAPTEAN